MPPEEAARRSDRAVRARLLNEAGPTFEFANDLIREILYRTTPQPVLTARHARAAALLADNPEAVGAHASAAGDLRDGDGGLAGRSGAVRRIRQPRRRAACWSARSSAARELEDRSGGDAGPAGAGPRARGARRVPGRLRRSHAGLELARETGDRGDGDGDPPRAGRGRDDRHGPAGARLHPLPGGGARDRRGAGRRRGRGLHPEPARHHRREPAPVRRRRRPRAARARRWPARWAGSARSPWRWTG